MEIRDQAIGVWKAVSEEFIFYNSTGEIIHQDIHWDLVDIIVELDGHNAFITSGKEIPSAAAYEIYRNNLDYFIVQFSPTETEVSIIEINNEKMSWVNEPNIIHFTDTGIIRLADKSIHKMNFERR